jgi:hypothetical protein
MQTHNRIPQSVNASVTDTAPTRARGGYYGRGLPVGKRADLAAQDYVQKRPIERPSLATYAANYRVNVAAVQRRLNGNGHHRNGHGNGEVTPAPSLAEHLRTASPAERIEAAKALGVDRVWDEMILPLVGNGKAVE